MVTTEINDHKSEMNSEIKVLSVAITGPDQRRGEQAQSGTKVDFKARAAALKAEQNAEVRTWK